MHKSLVHGMGWDTMLSATRVRRCQYYRALLSWRKPIMQKNRLSLRFFLLFLALGIVVGTTALTGEKGPPLEFRQVLNWPTLPDGIQLGGISAVATDAKDNVYVLNRTKPYVLVFDRDGKFLRSWNGTFKTPHGLRIDKD